MATNSGGPHTLKYGVTVNHVLGVEVVLPDGRWSNRRTGRGQSGLRSDRRHRRHRRDASPSSPRSGCGSRAIREAYRTLLGVFETVDDATNTISDIIGAGIIPAALEMIDQGSCGPSRRPFISAFRSTPGPMLHHGSRRAGSGARRARRERIVADCHARTGAAKCAGANADAERLLLWKCRKQAFGAVGRLSPSYCTQDGVVPRTKLPHILRTHHARSARSTKCASSNVFHAGDGNIHPILLFDERDADQVRRVLAASHEILDECIACGGSVTGEHGIGVEKIDFMPKLFTPDDLDMMNRLRLAFNPTGRLSPGKMLPTAGACGMEQKHPGRRAAM